MMNRGKLLPQSATIGVQYEIFFEGKLYLYSELYKKLFASKRPSSSIFAEVFAAF